MNQKCSSGSEGNQGVKLIKQANLFIDEDEVIRCKGRLNDADITQQSKNAVLADIYIHKIANRYTDMRAFSTRVSS